MQLLSWESKNEISYLHTTYVLYPTVFFFKQDIILYTYVIILIFYIIDVWLIERAKSISKQEKISKVRIKLYSQATLAMPCFH